jgi:lipopolysaccharide/colanic/teichoic acid biosynthesis glycosyltransferase
MSRRLLDIILSGFGILLLSPFLLVVLFLVWRQDRHSPFYLGERAGRNGVTFKMIKIRSMIIGADRTGVESTGSNDWRITPLGQFIRRGKIDELSQLWNVFKGDMSLVGPRPNTLKAVAGYSAEERYLLTVRPGITDFSSIVFSDEGEIIKNDPDPDAAYDRLIRPWKSKLGLLYVSNASAILNLKLIWLTVVAITNKKKALIGLQYLLKQYQADPTLMAVCERNQSLNEFVFEKTKQAEK